MQRSNVITLNNKHVINITESPRDASNKDSPASQADSGVFSIASSSSPSKEKQEGTSPDSPNRDRFSDQAFNRDMNCKFCYHMLRETLNTFQKCSHI